MMIAIDQVVEKKSINTFCGLKFIAFEFIDENIFLFVFCEEVTFDFRRDVRET
jgi:hypothetical protein